jgi:hypothetical protein
MKSAPAARVFCADWGILDSLRLLNRGKLQLSLIYDAVPEGEGKPDVDRIREAAENPGSVFLAHVEGLEFRPGANAKLVKTAEDLGYRKSIMAVIADSNGRPTYEAYRFNRVSAGAPAR